MKKLGKLIVLSTIIFALPYCSGSSSSDVISRFFPGTWETLYNIVIDECALLPEGQLSFIDEHIITQEGTTVSIEAFELPSGSYEGETRDEDSFLASTILEGDLFGIGINCVLTEDLAYNDLKNDTANSVYTIRIACDDGSSCDSFARGSALRIE